MKQKEEYGYPTSFDFAQWKKLFRYIRFLKTPFVLLLFAAMATALFDAIFPYFSRYAIDHFIALQTTEGLGVFALLYALAAGLQTGANVIYCQQCIVIEMKVGQALRDACFEHLQRLPLSFFNVTPVGYLVARVMSDTNQLGSIFSWRLAEFVWNGCYLIFVVISMFLLSWRLALLVLIVVPPIALVCSFFQRRLLRANRRVRRANSTLTASFNENISGAKTIKTLAVEDTVCREFREINLDMRRKAMHAKTLHALFQPLVMFLGSVSLALVMAAGGVMVGPWGIPLGTLAVFISYTMNIVEPIQMVVSVLADAIAVQANVERVNRLLETVPAIQDTPAIEEKYGDIFHPKKENWEGIQGDITFQDVTFRYPDGEVNVLEHFNLHIPAGSTVAIVGETGAGKSTLVNLACRFYEPTEGKILIDGVDYRERSVGWLHSNIGYVLQSPHLFTGTIEENIRYGKLDATREEIEQAAKMACAHDFIMAMPGGYQAQVGEGGSQLSTGQKQLISIARAIVANPRIFVLDEATSSVDTETEALIQQIIGKVLENRTSFLIAHRLSTVKNAHVILVVRDGKIIERGTHGELLRKHGYYYSLYTRQFQEERFQKAF